jgi:hypothetical protein
MFNLMILLKKIRFILIGLPLFQLLFLIVVFNSCKQSPLATSLAETDRLIIHFIDQGKIIKTVTTEEQTAIKKMVYALGKGEAKSTACDINGRMIFYRNDTELQQVEFNNTPDCMFFTFSFDNQQSFSSMTKETANFLQSVKQGLDFY